jgi:hypothetical protein
MAIASTRSLLVAWGAWGGATNIGLPRLSPMFGERALKTPLYALDQGPPEMMEVDKAVCQVELPERRLIIEKYQWRTPWWIATRQKGWSRSKYYRLLESAEWAVHVCLQK